MTQDNNDTIIRAYATLTSLRNNISKMPDVTIQERYVREFHAVLDRLDSVGFDVNEFRIPDGEINPRITSRSVSSLSGESHIKYSDDKYVYRTLLLIKIDAILGYFEIVLSEKPKSIGFRKPDET